MNLPSLRCLLILALGSFATKGMTAAAAGPSLYRLDRSWTNDQGVPFRLAELQGHPVLLAMFFTRCGSVCPATVSQLKQVEAAVPAATRAKVRIVLVSFDADGDTPAILAGYRSAMQLDGSWILLHGDADAVRELSAILGISYGQRGPGQFIHSGLVTLLDSSGVIAAQWPSLEGAVRSTARELVQTP